MKKQEFLEPMLIILALFTIVLQYMAISIGSVLTVITISALALYYLMSGALVLFDKRVIKGIRIIYFIGLWSISIGLLGLVFLLQFWPNFDPFLLFAFGLGAAVMIILLTYRQLSKEETQNVRDQMMPLFNRLLVYPILFLLLYFAPLGLTYESFGRYRNNEVYKDLLEKSIENPADTTLQIQLNEMEKELRK